MPLIYQHQINENSILGLWHISEPEAFFAVTVPLQRTITHPHKRLQHLAGRYLLTQLAPDFPPQLIQVASIRKPYLPGEAYHFSLSHCGDYAAAIISKTQTVGIDVELLSEKVARVQHKFISPAEQSLAAHFNNPLAFLTACWSIKEALFKWKGTGELDFKQHLLIDAMRVEDNQGVAQCRIAKDNTIHLSVSFLFFNDNCLSWVCAYGARGNLLVRGDSHHN